MPCHTILKQKKIVIKKKKLIFIKKHLIKWLDYLLSTNKSLKQIKKNTLALFEGDIVVVNRLDEFIKNNYDDPERSEDSEIQRGAAKNIQLWNNIKVGKTYHVPYVISNGIGELELRKNEFRVRCSVNLIFL